jgi:TolA-binding protein
MRSFLSVGLLLFLLLAAPAAHAQVESREGIFLQNQIQELKRDILTLRDQLSRGGGSSLGAARTPTQGPVVAGDVTAALLDRVARLEDEVRQLHGQADEAANAQRRLGEDLGKQIDDLNFKLDNGAGRSGGATPPPVRSPTPGVLAPVPGAPPTAPTAPAPKRTAEVALQEGNAALARRDYGLAEAAAREVLAIPKTPRAADAQFLLAQSMTGKKDFQAAAVAYDDTYNRARTGAHAPDSLLGLANSLNAIGEKRAACATLDKLRAEFPTLRADLREPVTASRTRAGCH